MIQLRPYQQTALDAIREAYRQKKHAPLFVSPTGSGKSAMLGYMLSNTRRRTLILAHRRELLDQISESLPVEHGIIAAGKPHNNAPVQVGMVQTVARRLDSLPQFEWVISDEAHLSVSQTWSRVIKHYPSALGLGLSATPTRLDGKGLGEHFDSIVYGPSIKQLVSDGYLTRCRVFCPPVEFEKIRSLRGDYDMAEAEDRLDNPYITGNAVEHLQRIGPGRKTIVFCCGVKHATHVAEQFRDAGISAIDVNGGMSDRAQRVADFKAGNVQVLTNVDLLTTGFDCPDIQAGVFLRPTLSRALYLQMVGRLLRVAQGKTDALLLDHVGCVLRHGLPDADREWSLAGTGDSERQAIESGLAIRRCDKCFLVYEAHLSACPYCGTTAETGSRLLEERDGQLVEITERDRRLEWLKSAEYGKALSSCETPEQIREMANARGYASGWTIRQVMGRFGVSKWQAAKMCGYKPGVAKHIRADEAA